MAVIKVLQCGCEPCEQRRTLAHMRRKKGAEGADVLRRCSAELLSVENRGNMFCHLRDGHSSVHKSPVRVWGGEGYVLRPGAFVVWDD
jgi:hypothetical protein